MVKLKTPTFAKMTDKQRKSIVRKCKKQEGWNNGESAQDMLIEQECIKRRFTLSEFYACDGNFLEKILS